MENHFRLWLDFCHTKFLPLILSDSGSYIESIFNRHASIFPSAVSVSFNKLCASWCSSFACKLEKSIDKMVQQKQADNGQLSVQHICTHVKPINKIHIYIHCNRWAITAIVTDWASDCVHLYIFIVLCVHCSGNSRFFTSLQFCFCFLRFTTKMNIGCEMRVHVSFSCSVCVAVFLLLFTLIRMQLVEPRRSAWNGI